MRRVSGEWAACLLAAAMLVIPAAAAGQQMDLARQGGEAVSDTVAALHLLRRATFGVRPEDLESVLAVGRTAWLERQLHPETIDDGELEDRLGWFPTVSLGVRDLVRDYSPPRPRPQPGDSLNRPDPQSMTPEERRMRAERSPQRILVDLVGAKLVRSAWTERQLEEVMTDFWFNHFNVSFTKGQDRYLVGDFERSAIRPYVFGRFEDMLRATARHPAMLFYLDNWTSSAPDSAGEAQRENQRRVMVNRIRGLTPRQREQLIRSGRITRAQLDQIERMAASGPAPRRSRGINENYARELMELHTLGVDGGYTQDDVINVARALTGWTFVPPGPPPVAPNANGRPVRRPMAPGREGEFIFRAEMHDTAEKIVLGHRLPSGRGMEDGLDVLHILATRPSTAMYLSTKLIERFVSDRPDPDFVDELAAVFTRTDGDLREVTRALFSSPRFYESRNVGAKVKSPFDLVASALRVTGAEFGPSRQLMETLRGLGELPYTETAPTGFPGTSEEWVNSGSMIARMNFGLGLVSGRMDGVRLNGGTRRREDAGGTAETTGTGTAGTARSAGTTTLGTPLDVMVGRILPGVDATTLLHAIRADLEEQVANGQTQRQLALRAAGLALGSPEFQRR
jgi:uncharacterized protein (DUF1800 family)